MRALVTGATGYVGGRLVPVLLQEGHEVRCFTRGANRLRDLPWRSQVDIAEGDVLDRGAVHHALAEVDVAYYLVHALGTGRAFGQSAGQAARTFAAAADDRRVGRIVYLGGLAPTGGELSPHLRSREEVGEILLAADTPAAVLRAAVILGSGSASFEMLRYLTERLPAMVPPRWVHNRIQPIAIGDVVRYLAACASSLPADVNRTFDIGGPDVLPYVSMMQRYAALAGLLRHITVPVPVLSLSLPSHWAV